MKENSLPVFNIERFAIHDGPGIRTTVFLQGCLLRCRWCANPESHTVGRHLMFLAKKCVGCGRCAAGCPQQAISLKGGKAFIDRTKCVKCGTCEKLCLNEAMQISGKEMTTKEIYDVIIRDRDYYAQTHGGVTFSGGEALLHVDKLLPLLEECRQNGIGIAFETCGQVPEENLLRALPFADMFLYDIKTLDEKKLRDYTGGSLETILNNFSAISKRAPEKITIRVPVIPGVNDTEEEIRQIFTFALQHKVKWLDLLPYHTLGITKYHQLGMEYPFDCTESLKKETLIPYLEMGVKMGLTVKIGG